MEQKILEEKYLEITKTRLKNCVGQPCPRSSREPSTDFKERNVMIKSGFRNTTTEVVTVK